jgi:hypothetical protein
LSIASMANDTIETKYLFASLDCICATLYRIFFMRSAERNVVFGPLNNRRFGLAGRCYLTSHEWAKDYECEKREDMAVLHRVSP